MDEVLLTASRVALLITGLGGAVVVLASVLRRRVRGRAWIPVVPALLLLILFADSEPFAAPVPIITLLLLPWFVGFPLLAATFPDGRFVPRWSRWAVAASVLAVAVNAATADAWRQSPWWLPFPVLQTAAGIGFIVHRYRRSATTSERESVRWVLLGLITTASLFALIQILDGTIGGRTGAEDPLGLAKANAAGIPLVLGLVIGLSWPRLWNVDAVFRGVLVLIFAGFALTGAYAAGEQVRPGVGTILVAVLAYPVVRIAFRAATALVFRSRLGPAAAIARLAIRLDADEPDPIPDRVLAVAVESTGSPAVALRAASAMDAAVYDASSGESASGVSREEFPITFHGELLATLEVAPRPGESELGSIDRAALAAIARHAAPALDGARALREATQAQRALVTAHEEERRRLRRELHDDLGPALSGIALSAAALARRAASDPRIFDAAIELEADIRDAAERSRQISHGLRPPLLDDSGLAAVLGDRLGAAEDVRLEVGELGVLPAAVDLAALRIVQEAVTNVRRHAAASTCVVRVRRDAAELSVQVEDDGIGIPSAVTAGMGLRSIRERAAELGGTARIDRNHGGPGTVVSVRLPIAGAIPQPSPAGLPGAGREGR